jgi:hypothetical protein
LTAFCESLGRNTQQTEQYGFESLLYTMTSSITTSS